MHADDPKQDQLQYIGVTYQCVEYARKWWMKTSGSPSAVSTAPTRFCTSPKGKTCKPSNRSPWLARSTVPPGARLGEGFGGVLPRPGRSRMASWPRRRGGGGGSGTGDRGPGGRELRQPALARSTCLRPPDPAVRGGGRYTLLDVSPTVHRNAEGGRIAGWLYPLADR